MDISYTPSEPKVFDEDRARYRGACPVLTSYFLDSPPTRSNRLYHRNLMKDIRYHESQGCGSDNETCFVQGPYTQNST